MAGTFVRIDPITESERLCRVLYDGRASTIETIRRSREVIVTSYQALGHAEEQIAASKHRRRDDPDRHDDGA